ncbi:MAG: DUF1569 domain-containing protein [Terracidiphilus sp.]
MRTINDAECKAEILARIGRVRPETARRWGKMTAGQMICHLSDSFCSVMGERPMSIAPGFSLWRLTKGIALHAPMRWPKGVRTPAYLDQEMGGTPPAEFGADVSTLCAGIEKFTQQPRAFAFCPHPLFGAMTEREWMRWGYLHCDHHLRQFGIDAERV